MAHTHEYDCIVCGAHFDSSEELDRHNHEEHIKDAIGMEQPRRPSSDYSKNRKEPPPAA